MVVPVGGCLRPVPEDKENHVFFPFFFFLFPLSLLLLLFWFGECFLEVLKGQDRSLRPEAGNLGISGHSNPLGNREHRGPLRR